MYLGFHGAAGEVTGSCHRLHVGGRDIVLDCGLFQGRRAETEKKNRSLPRWAIEADAVVLSHAHIDHSGNLPGLVKSGYRGNIYTTPATRDLASVMLRDSAMIQAQDAAYLNRKRRKNGEDPVEPLYNVEDAQQAVSQMISVPLHRPMPIAPGVTMTLWNAGHVLGSALVALDVEERGRKLRVLYTGDLGRAELPLLRDPEVVDGVNVLMMESTYGDRHHGDISKMDEALGDIVRRTIGRGGRVYIPSFALERAQEVLFALERLHDAGAIPRVPVYIDSPLAIAITEIYKLHPEGLQADVRARILGRDDPFSPPGLHYVSDIEASKSLQHRPEPCIVIAGSGMCEGGRILHHFRTGLGDSKNSVVIVGFMAQHTLGRRLLERRKSVKVFGVEREVWAEVHSIDGLSAHADQEDLVGFVRATAREGHLQQLVLVHGEDEPRSTLCGLLKEITPAPCTRPQPGDSLEF